MKDGSLICCKYLSHTTLVVQGISHRKVVLHRNTHTNTHTTTHTHTHNHTHTNTHTQPHTQTHTNTHTQTHIHTHKHTHKHTHTYIYKSPNSNIFSLIYIQAIRGKLELTPKKIDTVPRRLYFPALQ